jgi:hypothetical protein
MVNSYMDCRPENGHGQIATNPHNIGYAEHYLEQNRDVELVSIEDFTDCIPEHIRRAVGCILEPLCPNLAPQPLDSSSKRVELFLSSNEL